MTTYPRYIILAKVGDTIMYLHNIRGYGGATFYDYEQYRNMITPDCYIYSKSFILGGTLWSVLKRCEEFEKITEIYIKTEYSEKLIPVPQYCIVYLKKDGEIMYDTGCRRFMIETLKDYDYDNIGYLELKERDGKMIPILKM